MTGAPETFQTQPFADALASITAQHPEVALAEVFAVNLNGALHGKRVPLSTLLRLAEAGPRALRFQLSLAGLDVFGDDVAEARIAMEIGDPDGAFVPVPETLALAPFGATPMFVLQGMFGAAGEDVLSPLDPRGILLALDAKARAAGYTPVMALEIEFYLIDPAADTPARHPGRGTPLDRSQILDLDVLAAFDPVLGDIRAAAADLGLPADTILAEFGAGQFEINLAHTDAARACDQLVALKRLIRVKARAHGLDATFMAKPFTGWSGSGLHLHLSLLDADGRNVFDEPGSPIGRTLGSAIAGIADTARETFAMAAPHLNSYRRHRPGSYAPIGATWGLDNRGAALRVPVARGPAARLEHRIAGADANPYLVASLVLAGALHGLENGLEPGAPCESDVGDGAPFPQAWTEALDLFEGSAFVRDQFGAEFARVFAAIKRQEAAILRARVTDIEHAVYLRTV